MRLPVCLTHLKRLPKPGLRATDVVASDTGIKRPGGDAVWRVRHDLERRLHARRAQPLYVVAILVIEEVNIADADPGRGQPTQIFSARGNRIGRDIISAWLHAQIGPPSHPVELVVPDEMVHAIEVAPRRRAIIEHRTEEPLRDGRRLAGIVESLGEAGRQPSTGALSTNRDTSGICPKVSRLAPQPPPPRQAVIQRRWEGISGRFAVLHRDDKDTKFPCGQGADAIILDGAPDD